MRDSYSSSSNTSSATTTTTTTTTIATTTSSEESMLRTTRRNSGPGKPIRFDLEASTMASTFLVKHKMNSMGDPSSPSAHGGGGGNGSGSGGGAGGGSHMAMRDEVKRILIASTREVLEQHHLEEQRRVMEECEMRFRRKASKNESGRVRHALGSVGRKLFKGTPPTSKDIRKLERGLLSRGGEGDEDDTKSLLVSRQRADMTKVEVVTNVPGWKEALDRGKMSTCVSSRNIAADTDMTQYAAQLCFAGTPDISVVWMNTQTTGMPLFGESTKLMNAGSSDDSDNDSASNFNGRESRRAFARRKSRFLSKRWKTLKERNRNDSMARSDDEQSRRHSMSRIRAAPVAPHDAPAESAPSDNDRSARLARIQRSTLPISPGQNPFATFKQNPYQSSSSPQRKSSNISLRRISSPAIPRTRRRSLSPSRMEDLRRAFPNNNNRVRRRPSLTYRSDDEFHRASHKSNNNSGGSSSNGRPQKRPTMRRRLSIDSAVTSAARFRRPSLDFSGHGVSRRRRPSVESAPLIPNRS